MADSSKASQKPRKLSHRLRSQVGAGLLRALGKLPLLTNRRLGAVIGTLVWWFQGKTVKTCIENIDTCLPYLPEAERRSLAKNSIRETVKTALETASIWQQPYSRLEKTIVGHDQFDLMQRKAQSGKGVLVLAPHLGNWEILGDFLAQYYSVCYMYQPTEQPEIDALMLAGRTKNKQLLAPTNRKGVSMVLKHLQAGHLVAILPDQVPDRNSGDDVPFFTRKARTMTLVHKLIQRTGCEVILIFGQRTDGGFNIVFREPDTGIFSDDQTESLTAMNKSIEQLVAISPDQYQWEYKRFKGVK